MIGAIIVYTSDSLLASSPGDCKKRYKQCVSRGKSLIQLNEEVINNRATNHTGLHCRMNRIFYVARAVLLGLLTTQVLATLHVYLSNAGLYRTVTAIAAAGYLAVPNQQIIPTLKELGPAFYGGLFFTLSLGAGLSIFSAACAWGWDRIFRRNKALLLPVVILWAGAIVAVNGKGLSPIVASYFLVTPLLVFTATLKWMPPEDEKKLWFNRLVHIVPILLLTIIWTAHADRLLFLDIRDYLLLSNPVGRKVDDFYYRYTLYPAEVFKTLDQKTLKTCRLTAIKEKQVAQHMENALSNCDYLSLAADVSIDLEIVEAKDGLVFEHHGKTVIQTTFKEFFAQPNKALGQFSAKTDRHALFRQATIVCLLVGFPVLLYVMVFAVIQLVSGFLLSPMRSSAVAALLCFLIGLALLAPLRVGRSKALHTADLSKALDSDCWQQRVAALRTVASESLEIGNLQSYRKMLTSPHLPERYWLARALGASRDPKTYQDLLALLDDPHPNVVSMTLHALGQRGDTRAVKEILKRIETSDHWYNQWYAYRALRHLGWKQRKKSALPRGKGPFMDGN